VHAMVEDPYPVYRELRRNHPVYFNLERGFWAISRWSDVQAAARDWRRFSSEGGVDIDAGPKFFGTGDFNESDPPAHDRLRAVVRDAFAPRRIATMETLIRARVDELLDPMLERGHGEFVGELASQLPLAVIFELLGFPRSDGQRLVGVMRDVLARTPGDSELPDRALGARRMLEDYIFEAATRRRQRPRDDLLSVLVAAERSRSLAPEELVGTCLLLLLAGWETSSVLAANAIWLLARHPDQRRRLTRRHDLIPAAIEEILRYESPAQHHMRTAVSDIELHDQTIPAGDRVLLLWASANRDETRWPDGEQLELDREPRRNLAFGEGVHHCLGAPLARLEGRLVIEAVLGRNPSFEVGPVERFNGVVIRGISRLPVEWG
jgi:cytochrome P450